MGITKLPMGICLVCMSVSCSGGGGRDAGQDVEGEDPVLEDPGSDPALDEVDLDVEDGWEIPAFEWSVCSLYEGEDDHLAECAEMEVPLRWGSGDGRTFVVAAKRLQRTVGMFDGQMWFLEGGPGGSGFYGYAQYMHWLRRTFPTWEAYVLDARGTGHSGFLECPADSTGREVSFESPISEVEHCIDHLEGTYGDDLEIYGATQSSHDLAAFIEATRVEGVMVMIWGNSAGTYWAQRFLQVCPDCVDGVIVEALLPPDFFGGFQDEGQDAVLKAILAMCRGDSFCSTRLPDPEASLASLLASLEAGHCSEHGWSADALRGLIGGMLYYRPFNAAIPAVIHRLTRCSAADAAALDSLTSGLGFPGPENGFSIAVFFNEYFSEMWDHPTYTDSTAYIAYLDAVYADALALGGEGYAMNEIFRLWPLYDDPLDDAWAVTDTPMLMLQGHLDPATPYAMASSMADGFTGAHQHFLEFPTASHAVVFGTPLAGDADCGVELVTGFMADPTASPDATCMGGVLPLDFEGTGDAFRIMGTADFWEG